MIFIPELRKEQMSTTDNTDLREILTKRRHSSGGISEIPSSKLKQNIQVCINQSGTLNHDEKRHITVSPIAETQQVIIFCIRSSI